MTYAAFVQVDVDPDSESGHRHAVLNEFVIPEMRFDTEEQAARALGVLAPDNSPRVVQARTCAVELEA